MMENCDDFDLQCKNILEMCENFHLEQKEKKNTLGEIMNIFRRYNYV